jgi:hypothetical protein
MVGTTITPAKVGSVLGRAGFLSRRGTTWANGFKASKFMPGTVAVTAHFNSAKREREALESYISVLVAAGFDVDDQETTLFVSCR